MYGFHEVTHVSSLLADWWATWILEHGATKTNKKLHAKADKIADLMLQFYQEWSQYSFKKFPDSGGK